MNRILVCDDSDFVRKMIKRELESSYELEVFQDGVEAYEFLQNDSDFDFAIIDGEMPRMNGWELIKKIKQKPEMENLPVVILTASEDEYFQNSAFDYGAFDYLKKPFKSGELYKYLNDFFKGDINRGVVLVVEDSKLQNHTISQQLKLKHLKPVSVYSGEEAIEVLLKGENVDTILLDLHLTGASGFQIAKALKKDSRFEYLPIIGITASSDKTKTEVMEKAFLSGVDDFISKPYNLVEFYARIMANVNRGKLVKRLKEESELDYLTKLYNRRTLFKILEHLFSSSVRYKNELSFLMIDIDHFKVVNDTYGHFIGDEVLKEVAELINSSIRQADVAGRFGGEEFCVVMPHTGLENACVAADKLRRAVESRTINIRDLNINITISAGVTSLDFNEKIESFIKRADDALYKAKESGRNRVCYCSKDDSVSACIP